MTPSTGTAATSAPPAAAAGVPGQRVKVGVLVDLAFSEDAGGHVKCWQRLAEAAVGCADRLDLTVHFSGPQPRRIELSPSVRYVVLPPVLSSALLVRDVPDHTDLAPWHRGLARALSDYDVIHTTDAFFCYARTAARFARRHGVPLVSSIHTNTPEYARITTAKLLERKLGAGRLYRAADGLLALPRRVGARLERRLDRHLAAAVSAPAGHIGLRRGLDRALFSPARRDRAWFEQRFGLPPGHLVAMYAGRLNAGKNVPLLAPVIDRVRRAGVDVHLLCAGTGPERASLERALGPALTCAGQLGQDELARAYASADLFLFPSTIDEWGNAAVEALGSGLPALVAAGSGVADAMADCTGLLVLPGDRPEAWAAAIVALAAAPDRRAVMGRAARRHVETHVPSWAAVLAEDLLPAWLAARRQRDRG